VIGSKISFRKSEYAYSLKAFYRMTISVKLKGQSFNLSNWEQASFSANWVRRLAPNDNFSCVGWMVSRSNEDMSSDRYHWVPMFLGKDLYNLCKIYYEFYPSLTPFTWSGKYYPSLSRPLLSFQDFQIEEAKQHMDKFISRVNSMNAFL
jgi:hypothetical protein